MFAQVYDNYKHYVLINIMLIITLTVIKLQKMDILLCLSLVLKEENKKQGCVTISYVE